MATPIALVGECRIGAPMGTGSLFRAVARRNSTGMLLLNSRDYSISSFKAVRGGGFVRSSCIASLKSRSPLAGGALVKVDPWLALNNVGLFRGFSSGKRWFKWKSKQAKAAAVKDVGKTAEVKEQDIKAEAKKPPAKKNSSEGAKKQESKEKKKPAEAQAPPNQPPSTSGNKAKEENNQSGNAGNKKKKITEASGIDQSPGKPTEAPKTPPSKNARKVTNKESPKAVKPQPKAPKNSKKPEPKPVESSLPVKPAETSSNVEKAKVVINAVETGKKTSISGKAVVVVESPAKARTIEKYLGGNFTVVASYGHVRDLAARSGSVRPQDDFELIWEVPDNAKTRFGQIKTALKGAQAVVLASDPDREGEAIAWHVLEMLKIEGALKSGLKVHRVTFNEITKQAVLAAISSPREISQTLVDAYLARRALDYLIGFDISPLLWRKLPGSKSAGRVQSAALCILSDREREIESFKSRDYWTIEGEISPEGAGGAKFPARLVSYNGVKLEQFTLSGDEAAAAAEHVSKCKLLVQSVKSKLVHRNAADPYITSTLQQDASSKLGFSASKTMELAQKLYEGVKITDDEATGLLTYMRTDSPQLSVDATENIRSFAEERYGKDCVTRTPRVFKSKVRNAQEAHEAIRPTDIRRLPSSLMSILETDALRLYALIWIRTMACQLKSAISNQMTVDLEDSDKTVVMRSTGSSSVLPGYTVVFQDKDAQVEEAKVEAEEANVKALSVLQTGHSVSLITVQHKKHSTEPPPRYTDGSLVRKMEELGIGRPSTYAHILKTLELRRYIRVEKQRIFTQVRGRMVAAFLSRYFSQFVDYGFTAKMEEQLDSISAGNVAWKDVMRQFWPDFHAKVASTSQVSNKQVAQMLAELFSDKLAGKNRTCPDCHLGELELKLTKFGAGYFLGCNRYPSCHYCNSLDDEEEEEETGSPVIKIKNRVLGVDTDTGLTVYYKEGPYGDYIQIGEDAKGKLKPKRVRLPSCLKPDEVTLELALELLQYPKVLGHDAEGKAVAVGIGKMGCYIRRDGYSVFVPKDQKVEELTMETALVILEKGKEARRKTRKSPILMSERYALSLSS